MPSYSRKVQIPGRTSKDLFEAVSQDIDRFLSKAAVGKYQVERDPSRKELKIKSSLFSATLKCAESEMVLDAQLSLLAMPFKTKFDESINRWLSKTFNLSTLV